MNNLIGLMVDLALVAVAAIILIVNTKKGFLYSVTVLTGKFVSIIFALFASRYVSFIFSKPAYAIWEKLGEWAQRLPFIPHAISVILAFIVTLVIVRIVFKLIASATSNIKGAAGTVNHVLGFVLGLAIAFIAVQLIAVAIYVISLVLTVLNIDLGRQISVGAKLTRWVFDNNVLIGLLRTFITTIANLTGATELFGVLF